ncbi:hypothetical protein [Alkalimonas sp.]|uniref:hypothetical protein n=1 Tax=Alkalimonas sp. TaxID=1872453 RepID=UPI00263B0C3E|nr:hypothetical protein [Alkalimonas sp.]MCC5826372.1 hypothetical protein [Alkalimonas sp.]
MSQKRAREALGAPDTFRGGCYVTRNGVAELFIQTADERAEELAAQERERQSMALLKLAMLAEQDIRQGDTLSAEQALQQLRAARR